MPDASSLPSADAPQAQSPLSRTTPPGDAIIAADAHHQVAYATLARTLLSLKRPVQLRLNHNRRILISLRGGGIRPLVMSIHPLLLGHAQAMADLPGWLSRGGGRCSQAMRSALDQVSAQIRHHTAQASTPVQLALLGGPVDLERAFAAVHQRFFPALPRPAVAWSKEIRKPRQRHLRFASYRAKPSPLVRVHPRLDQEWVAVEFVNFVLYHELCHHAQACDPRHRETAHSSRFRSWERKYPDIENLLLWEKQHLERFLQPSQSRP